jgi:uncharacterized beta-barrel protein YwiB (DUF1934 family)
MKLQIHSTQKYSSHIDEINEVYDCEISQMDKKTCILYSKGRFVFDKNSVIIENDDNKLFIRKGITTNLTYNTEHGSIDMKITGISIDIKWNKTVGAGLVSAREGDISVRFVYEIILGNNSPYVNDVRLTIIR